MNPNSNIKYIPQNILQIANIFMNLIQLFYALRNVDFISFYCKSKFLTSPFLFASFELKCKNLLLSHQDDIDKIQKQGEKSAQLLSLNTKNVSQYSLGMETSMLKYLILKQLPLNNIHITILQKCLAEFSEQTSIKDVSILSSFQLEFPKTNTVKIISNSFLNILSQL